MYLYFSPPIKGKLSDNPFNITCPVLSMESISEWHVLNGSDTLSGTSLTKDSLVSPLLIQSVYSNTNQTHRALKINHYIAVEWLKTSQAFKYYY